MIVSVIEYRITAPARVVGAPEREATVVNAQWTPAWAERATWPFAPNVAPAYSVRRSPATIVTSAPPTQSSVIVPVALVGTAQLVVLLMVAVPE